MAYANAITVDATISDYEVRQWGSPYSYRVVAKCPRLQDARQIAALLRFASAMTPEMWESLEYALRTGAAGDRVKSALDTLRQEIQQP